MSGLPSFSPSESSERSAAASRLPSSCSSRRRDSCRENSHSTCFFLLATFQILQHRFSSRLFLSWLFLIATTLVHVLWRSRSSKRLTTSSTKYLVGLYVAAVATADAASSGAGSSGGSCTAAAPRCSRSFTPASRIASRYPLIHSFPTAILLLLLLPRRRRKN